MVKKIENTLAQFFKDLPDLPNSSREVLVKIWPWLAVLFGVLQLTAAWALWDWMSVTERLDQYSSYYITPLPAISGFDRFIVFLGIVVLVVNAVIFFKAYPELTKRTRRGWDLLFLAALINVGYSLVSIFIQGRGIGSFVFGLLGSLVGFYFLFQVRSKYKAVDMPKKQK